MRNLLIALATLALWGCKGPERTVETTVLDRLETETTQVPRDTVITTPRDAVEHAVDLDTPVKPKDVPKRTKRKGRATSTLEVTNGVVTAECVCDTASYRLRLWDRWTKQRHDRTVTRSEEVVRYRTPAWAWWLAAACALPVLWQLWTLFKRFYPGA